MKRLIKLISLSLLFASCLSLVACYRAAEEKKIGIIIPIEHNAMNEIISGFKDELNRIYPNAVKFKLANAQGDLNIQRAIIQQMQQDNYDLIVPIGTGATEMAVSMVHKTPILSLASLFSEKDRKQQKFCHIGVVHDEISVDKLILFLHAVYPEVSRVVLIHSATDKIYADVKKAIQFAKQYQITIKPMMVPSLNELYSTVNNIGDAQAILVLKDNLIVSGMGAIVIAAKKRQIPLMTSDQGSVENGAHFALGVHERQIGLEGAKIANKVLSGENICNLPMIDMSQLTVFLNKSTLAEAGLTADALLSAAKKLGYRTEFINRRGR